MAGRHSENRRARRRGRSRAPITEQSNRASAGLDTRTTAQILRLISREDAKVPPAVRRTLPEIARAVDLAVKALRRGGRMVYLGAGTSGRLGVLDAAECMPTFGSAQVVGVMAGAPRAMFRPTETSEDDPKLAVRDLRRIRFSRDDLLVGISASGRTPYVMGGLRYARRLGAATVTLTCNADAPARALATVTIAAVVGPEVIAGSTRMKAGTAQKLVLNMLSTATMVRLGRVFSNLMVDVQLRNAKLRQRAQEIATRLTGASPATADRALRAADYSLPVALLVLWKRIPAAAAREQVAGASSLARLLRAAQAESDGEVGG